MKPNQSVFICFGSFAKRQRKSRLRSQRVLRPLSPTLHFSICLLAALAPFTLERSAAATRTWIGGNVDWVDFGSAANWSPAGEPTSNDSAIFNTANSVNLGSANTVLSLALSNGISINTKDFNLAINGLLQLNGAGTDLTIGGSDSTVWVDGLTLASSGRINLTDGVLAVPLGIIDNNAGCTVSGRGIIALNAYSAATKTLFDNDGTLAAAGPVSFFMPAAGSLVINASYATARIDLDGTNEAGIVNVGRNQLLDINVPSGDLFGGTMNLFHASTIDIASGWNMDTGTLNVNNGATSGMFPIPALSSYIAGGTFTQSGGTITVEDTDCTLQFNSPFLMTGGNLVNNGLVVFNANTTIGTGANFTMPTSSSSLTVNPSVTVTVNQANFIADGSGFETNVLTVNGGGSLNLNFGAGADEDIQGKVALNGGILNVTTADNTWSLKNAVTLGANTGISEINGEPVTFADSTVGLGTNAVLRVNAASTLNSTSSFAVATGATLGFVTAPVFNGASFTGDGIMRVEGSSTVAANTTIAVNTFDWDWNALGNTHTINTGVTFTINSPVWFDAMNDAVTLQGTGSTLTVNGSTQWNMDGALNSNPAGTATVGGSSRVIFGDAINANSGTTAIVAPATLTDTSLITAGSGALLSLNGDTIFRGGSAVGLGTLRTNSTSTVTANTTVAVDTFGWDGTGAGSLQAINDGVTFTINSPNFDTDGDMDDPLTMGGNGATLKVNSLSSWTMLKTLTTNPANTGVATIGGSSRLILSSAGGILNANGNTTISAPVTFGPSSATTVAANVQLTLGNNATFDGGAITGAGRLQTNRGVYFNESTTLDMVGGSLDLDGADTTGDTIYIKAPVNINAATMDSFGNFNTTGANIIDVNHWTSTGSFAVNLDSPTAEWTLNQGSVLVLKNDPAAASVTLLTGSPVNLNGYVQITGDVRTDARLDIGDTIDIQTVAKPFRLSGGDLTDVNTLVGGTINGPGILGADSGSSLYGFGSVNAAIDFDGSSDLLADNGTLTINGSILDARYVGTNDTDGILSVVNAWDSAPVTTVLLQGGELRGGTLTINNSNGIFGRGLVASRLINNTKIQASGSGYTLVVQTAANNNDWDGASGTGSLIAAKSTLEIRDNVGFPFSGTVNATTGGTVFANGFTLGLESASTLSLTAGTFQQSAGTYNFIYGTVSIGTGTSTLRTEGATGGFSFNSSSNTTLIGDLQLDNPAVVVLAGATFSGAGRLINQPGRLLAPDNTATMNVLVENRGTLSPGTTSYARNNTGSFVQTSTGKLVIGISGTSVGNFDWLQVDGIAQLAGNLNLTLGGYVPALGDTIPIIATTGVVTGTFTEVVQPAGMPVGLAFEPVYASNNVQLKVVSVTPFDAWIDSFGITDPAQKTQGADPDSDGLNNLGEFALDGDPTSGANNGKIVGKIAPVGGSDALTLTLPVRYGTVLDPADPVGGELGLKQTADGLHYKIQASDDLLSTPLDVTEVTGPDAAAIWLGLPALNPGWTYRSFRSPGPVTGDPQEFMRAVISDESPAP